MAWNPKPEVAAARDFGEQFRKDQVIIVSVDLQNETIEVTTYGKTKALCEETKHMGDTLYDAAYEYMAGNS